MMISDRQTKVFSAVNVLISCTLLALASAQLYVADMKASSLVIHSESIEEFFLKYYVVIVFSVVLSTILIAFGRGGLTRVFTIFLFFLSILAYGLIYSEKWHFLKNTDTGLGFLVSMVLLDLANLSLIIVLLLKQLIPGESKRIPGESKS